MTNEDKLHEVKAELTEAICQLYQIKEYQSHFDMSRSINAIVEFINDNVPVAVEGLERAFDIVESIELEEEEHE